MNHEKLGVADDLRGIKWYKGYISSIYGTGCTDAIYKEVTGNCEFTQEAPGLT
jgi:hypothetical protein